MIIGVPTEIKTSEYRVAMTPGGAREYISHGHRVLVQAGAGAGSALPDEAYAGAGAEIVPDAATLFAAAEMVIKVKEPQPSEIEMLRPGQLLFAYLHLAPDPVQTEGLIASGATCIAFETVELRGGALPLLAPMSEVAGRMAAQAGAELLQKPSGGRGVLMGGVPGVLPANVVVLGAGVVGYNAAYVALGMGAHVTVVDIDIDRLRRLNELWGSRVRTLYSNRANIDEATQQADLLIGAVLLPGAKAPTLVTRDMIEKMQHGSVVIDVSVDQGGCVETIHPTTHDEPTYLVSGVVHYGVANMPGAVPHTSTYALEHATLPYGLALADKGWRRAVAEDGALACGVNVLAGHVVNEAVAAAQGRAYASLGSLL